MADTLPGLFVDQFSALLHIVLEQTQSMLRGRAMEGQHVGKLAAPIQYLGAIQMQANAGFGVTLTPQNPTNSRRWVAPVNKEAVTFIDRFDQLQLLADPQSQYLQVAAAAVAREWDDRLIAAAFGTAQLGTDPGSANFLTESFNTNSPLATSNPGFSIAATFGSTANSGLTVAKMIETKRAMRKLQVPVDTEPLTWVTNSQGEADLLNQVQVVSTEFNDRPVLTDGKVTRFLGWDICYSERLPASGTQGTNQVRQNIAAVKSGWYLGIWKDVENNVHQRFDLSSLPWQLWTGMSSGAVRLEPGRLFQCLCSDQSAAADVTP